MKKCKRCKVLVYESEKRCPLCQNDLGKTKDTLVMYPKYKDIVAKNSPLNNVPLFISLAAIISCIYINIFTHDAGDAIWSIIVSISVLYVLSIFYIIKNSLHHGTKILLSYLSLSIFLIVIDFSTRMLFWSTDFVFPFLTLATLLYLMILATRSKALFSEYFGYILVITPISFISIPLYLLGFNNYVWGVFVVPISCLIIALGLYLFADKKLKEEVKKRFYRS